MAKKAINLVWGYLKDIEFINPDAFLLFFIFIPVLLLLVLSYRKDIKILSLLKVSLAKVFRDYLLLFIVFLFLFSGSIGMLAQPRLQVYSESDIQIQSNYIFLVDVSKSTDARFTLDSKTQLELAKEIIIELLDTVEGSRIQIFAYTSAAFPMSDFTTDTKHIEDTLDKLIYIEVTIKSGSDLPNALAFVARKKMNDERYNNINQVILISDGQISSKYIKKLPTAMDMLKDQNISLTTVGVGSIVGWRIPMLDKKTGKFTGGYVKNFVSVLNERNLQILANFTGGAYFNYEELDALKNHIIDSAQEEGNVQISSDSRELLESKNVSWIFVPFVFIGLFILVLKRNLI